MSKVRFASIVVTYRCNARCRMCGTWRHPSARKDEAAIAVYEKLPPMDTVNVTGGEPFLREDIEEVVGLLRKKAGRLVISSNGFDTERILDLFRRHKDIGIRVSIEGLAAVNDDLRGVKGGYERGLRTLEGLRSAGVRDIGFGITVSDRNAGELMELYRLSRTMGFEFATAAVHNSYYFHKHDNRFEDPGAAVEEFGRLVRELLGSGRVKDWFRAYFNYGLMNYIRGNPRLLPCEMGHDSFFLDPSAEVFPCNVMEESMGNLREASFEEIWNGKRAEEIRGMVRGCRKNCWMIGSVATPMKKHIWRPALWVLRHKFLKKEPC